MLVGGHAQTRSHTRDAPDTQRDLHAPQGLPPRQRPDAHMARADCIPDRPHERPPPPGPLTRCTPTQRPHGPGNQHHLGGHMRPHCSPAAPGTRSAQAPSECVHEMGERMQVPAGHPVAFSADSSWEGPLWSGQHPDHHLDIQTWGSPTTIAAG
ncbi:unnamed protein product [Rangifer tarandus platyrhynchus]|uniref:Uncharacterized protein n=1 Tax=Rangifer tarandus platyrhynchus TaxID=3082113 RepID=A0AC59YPX6_RANTA